MQGNPQRVNRSLVQKIQDSLQSTGKLGIKFKQS